MTIKEAEIISNYLGLIKKNLPLSIKLKKNEMRDILDEIEEHIWEKVIESAGDKEPTEIDIQITLSQMGEPKEIATSFVSKSTPYVYISEELYPTYKRYRKTVFWSFLLWVILFFAPRPMGVGYMYLYELVENPLYNYILIMPIVVISILIIIGIIFCYLSITGYVPYEIRASKLKKRYINHKYWHKLVFKPYFQNAISILFLTFLFSALSIFLVRFSIFTILFVVLSITKFLRGFYSRKSVNWQKLLIVIDIFLISVVFLDLLLLRSDYYYHIQNFLIICLFFYIYYEILTFTTFRDRKDLYLKELSIVDRLRKKESLIGDLKSNIIPNTQKFSDSNNAFGLELEEKIRTFLKKARRKLPLWLKMSKKGEIIHNLDDEIRENIQEFEATKTLTEENLNQLISEFEIYISTEVWPWYVKTTPRIYISKEVWPWFVKTLKAIFVYFIILTIFVVALSSLVLVVISLFIRILLILLTCTVILITRAFIFFSLNGFNFRRKESLRKVSIYRYPIWETLFAVIYVTSGIIILSSEINSGELFTNSRSFTLILIIVVSLLLLGLVKSLKMVFKKKGLVLKSFLIISSLILGLVINFLIEYQFSTFNPFIRSYHSMYVFSFLFLPINIEIIYEIFHLFFQIKPLEKKVFK